MGLFSKKNNSDVLKTKNKDRVEMGEFQGQSVFEVQLIPTVLVIGANAFRECRSLKRVLLPERVCEIGDYAFRDCDVMEEFNFPDTMRYPDGSYGKIGRGCFEGCGLLRRIIIPEGISTIETNAFRNCAALESVKLPRTIRAIHMGAFSGCARLETLDMPVTPELIAADAFWDTPKQEEMWKNRKPILTIVHTSSFGTQELFQFSTSPRYYGIEQTDRDMSIVLDACDDSQIMFRISQYRYAGGRHTVPFGTLTQLFKEDYDCAGAAGHQSEEINALYR